MYAAVIASTSLRRVTPSVNRSCPAPHAALPDLCTQPPSPSRLSSGLSSLASSLVTLVARGTFPLLGSPHSSGVSVAESSAAPLLPTDPQVGDYHRAPSYAHQLDDGEDEDQVFSTRHLKRTWGWGK